MSQPLLLNLRNLACGYQDQRVVQNLNLHLNAGDIGCLLGSSGCGKTTTLRAIAGFEPVHEGEIQLAGETISSAGFTLAPEKRRIGMVFQDYALFPHLTVAQNVAFGLHRGFGNPSRRHVPEAARRWMAEFEIDELGNRFPSQISGGQQQRVALARALAPAPTLLLLDEPFAALDTALRGRLRDSLVAVQEQLGLQMLVITHDPADVEALGQQVLHIREGRLQDAPVAGVA